MRLPNNKVIGHKKFELIYKQRLRLPITEEKMLKYLEDRKDRVENIEALQKYEYEDLKA